jgi:hypothetical protein
MTRVSTDIEQFYFDREHEARNQLNRHGLPLLESGDLLALADFEQWAANELQNWYRDRESSENLCCLLAKLLQNYSRFTLPPTTGVQILCLSQ